MDEIPSSAETVEQREIQIVGRGFPGLCSHKFYFIGIMPLTCD